jgi:hypothetical protein
MRRLFYWPCVTRVPPCQKCNPDYFIVALKAQRGRGGVLHRVIHQVIHLLIPDLIPGLV